MITKNRRATTTDNMLQRFIHDDEAAEVLVDVFYQELLSDFGDCRRIICLYADGPDETRTLIDSIFTSLCGLSFYSLISKTEDRLDSENSGSMTFHHLSRLPQPDFPANSLDWFADAVLADIESLERAVHGDR